MRQNEVKLRLHAGGHAFGTMVMEFFVPSLPQIAGVAGADFALFDMEHTGVGMETVKAQVAACRGTGIAPFVRVPTLQQHFIARCLDIGATGIMVPMVESAAQAREIVAATRYPPIGRRGAAFRIAHDDFEDGAVEAKISALNDRALVIAMVETAKGVEAVDEIAAVEGVDVLWLGHFDLTNFMGIPGQFQHPGYQHAVAAIVTAADRHGKAAGMMAADEQWAADYIARGFRVIAYGLDYALYQRALSGGIASMRKLVQ